MLGVECHNEKLVVFEFIPVTQDLGADVLRQMIDEERVKIVNNLETRSKILFDLLKLDQQWQVFCRDQKRLYQTYLFGFDRMLHLINKFKCITDISSKRGEMIIGNVLRCASHLEVLKTIYSLEKTIEEVKYEK